MPGASDCEWIGDAIWWDAKESPMAPSGDREFTKSLDLEGMAGGPKENADFACSLCGANNVLD
jgi:hypothetical protein